MLAGVFAVWQAGTINGSLNRQSSVIRTKQIICQVFGPYCGQAIRVVKCETGGTFSVWASNGQYHGLFQMGRWERRTYGESNNAWGQAKAAFRYFVDSGKDWSPWECKP